MRVLIVEEVLGSFQSHHYAYQSAIATGAQELRVDLDLLINIKAAGLELNFPMAGRNPPRAVLRTMSALSMGGEDGIANRPKRIFVLAWNVWANVLAVRRVLRKEPRYDLVLCPTTWMPHVVMFLLLSLLEGNRLGNLCLLFVRYPKLGVVQPWAFRAIKRWINLLCAVHPRTRILAETKYAQRSWGELLGRPVGYVVHPVEAAQPPRTDSEGRMADDGERDQPLITQIDTDRSRDAGPCLDKPSGAAFSNPFTSELARDSENTSLTRSASGPAWARIAPEDRRSAQLSSESTSRAKEIGDRGAAGPPRTEDGERRTEEEGEPRITQHPRDSAVTKGKSNVWAGSQPERSGVNDTKGEAQGDAQGACAGAYESDSLASELADAPVSESHTRSASGPASLPATSYSLPATAPEAPTPATSYPPLATLASPIVFGFYGFARHEQGVDVLMRALEILKDKGELDAEFRIVWPKAFQMPDGSWMDREMFGHLGPNVRFFENPLTPSDYLRELLKTDWLILPYRVASYEGRCSRISIEACVMGIPVIYTHGTDLEEVVRSHGEGIGVPQEDADALASAIRLAVQENRAFQEKAESRKAAAQAYFTGKLFLDKLIKQ